MNTILATLIVAAYVAIVFKLAAIVGRRLARKDQP